MIRMCREEKTISSDRATKAKAIRAKAIKIRRRETPEGFSRKRKAYAFCGDSAVENDG
jgi:hypothetical protein